MTTWSGANSVLFAPLWIQKYLWLWRIMFHIDGWHTGVMWLINQAKHFILYLSDVSWARWIYSKPSYSISRYILILSSNLRLSIPFSVQNLEMKFASHLPPYVMHFSPNFFRVAITLKVSGEQCKLWSSQRALFINILLLSLLIYFFSSAYRYMVTILICFTFLCSRHMKCLK
jgi:hypothetical protein